MASPEIKRFFQDYVRTAAGLPFYIGALYTQSESLGGNIKQIWEKTGNIDDWYDRLKPILAVQPHSINFTPVLRSEPNSKNTSVSFAPALWADIDNYLWDEWKKSQYLQLHGSVLEPTLCVDSGWGVHLYWLLEEGLNLTDYAVRAKFEKTAALLAWLVGADTQSSCSPSHLMRLPGSYNCKSAPYYKEGKIEYTRRGRISFAEISDEVQEYAESWLKQYKLSPCSGEEVSRGAMQVERILYPSKLKQGTARGYADGEKIKADISVLEERLKKEATFCPLLDLGINHPESIGYGEWRSFGCGLAKKLEPDIAEELFYKFSIPGNRAVNPDADIRGQFRRWAEQGLMPANCDTKLCVSCDKAGRSCRSILSVLSKAFREI